VQGKTSISINPDLYKKAKARAALEGIPVGKLIADALEAWLRARRRPNAEKPCR
jgi:hypothetical protein